ncbi:MAG: hypothetical protein NC120_09885 [Ruminococcus sp.]|nr:hypothetical protein [Ruminococcus sp.]
MEKKINRDFDKSDKIDTHLDTEENVLRTVIKIDMANDSCSYYFTDSGKIEEHCNLNNYLYENKKGYIYDTHIFEIKDDSGEISKRINADRENFSLSITVTYTVASLNDSDLVDMIKRLEKGNPFTTIFSDFDYVCHEKESVPDRETLSLYIKEYLLKKLQFDLEYVY